MMMVMMMMRMMELRFSAVLGEVLSAVAVVSFESSSPRKMSQSATKQPIAPVRIPCFRAGQNACRLILWS